MPIAILNASSEVLELIIHENILHEVQNTFFSAWFYQNQTNYYEFGHFSRRHYFRCVFLNDNLI
jgi:hypothetical protein